MNPWLKASTPESEKKTLASHANLYEYYERAVQSPKKEVHNLLAMYHTMNTAATGEPVCLREDFCGTAQLCAAWLASHHDRRAIGIDLDASVLNYAKNKYFSDSIESNIKLVHENVLHYSPPPNEPLDLLIALNYSLCYFHHRADLIKYLGRARLALSLKENQRQMKGIFIADLFGGSVYFQGSKDNAVKTVRDFGDFKYYFEQKPLNLLDHQVDCQMSFKFKDGSLAKNAFHYDFRMWNIMDIKEALLEVGFTKIHLWISESFRSVDTLHSENITGQVLQQGREMEVENFSTQFEHICLTDEQGGKKKLSSLTSWNAYIVAQ